MPKLETLKARAKRQTNIPQFRELAELIPPGQRDDPRAVLSWFMAAAEFDRKGADSWAYRWAIEALQEFADAQNMVDRASRVYRDAISSGLVSQEEADRLWADPTALAAKIEELRGSDQYWENLLVQEAAALHYEVQAMPADDAESEPGADVEPPLPDGPRAADEFEAYLEARGEEDPSPETEPAQPHPRDDNAERMSTPGPTL